MNTLNHEEIERRIHYLQRGVDQIIERDELAWKIDKSHREGRSLIIKLGVDPTSPDLHLGHTVPLMKLRHFQDLGYSVDFLIGDFTGRIGDPSGRSAARKPMTEEEVLHNAEQYKRQIFKILNPDLTKIVYNSSWLNALKPDDFIRLMGKGTVNDQIKRKGVANRLEEGNPVSVAEFVYPFLQAYDSVAMRADIEIGGADQYFNFVFTRDLQRTYGQEPEVILTLPLLIGLDGEEKMSKTYKNHVALEDSPKEMFGKLMSIPDTLIETYFDLLTKVPYEEVTSITQGLLNGSVHPRDAKVRLASEIVSLYHDSDKARIAAEEFDRVHKYREMPQEIETGYLSSRASYNIGDLLMELGMASSKRNAREVISRGGVRIDGEIFNDPYQSILPEEGMVVNVGKRSFKKIGYTK